MESGDKIITAKEIREEIAKAREAKHQALVEEQKRAIIEASQIMLQNLKPIGVLNLKWSTWLDETKRFAKNNGFEIKKDPETDTWGLFLLPEEEDD